MPQDRNALKSRAREVIATSNPRVLTVGLVYLVLTVVLSTLGARVMSVNISESEAMNYLNYAMNGNYEYALRYAETMTPPPTAYAINALLMYVAAIVGAGFTIFLLNTLRNRQPCFANLLDGFSFWWKLLILDLLQSLLIGLWSLLLIIPGVMAHYRYAQALYILIDDPTKSPVQCLRESKAMMNGHKMELFKLDLSFLGWYLLEMIPYVGYAVQVWSVPYVGMTKALYYETLLGSNVWSYTPDYPA
ncbi:MAG: DUF975 family protein [Oscillospiraceae bacterium]|nr:DUF975 family protein [Oscillospiraceae bacterium]